MKTPKSNYTQRHNKLRILPLSRWF